jgi:hypothetical protein
MGSKQPCGAAACRVTSQAEQHETTGPKPTVEVASSLQRSFPKPAIRGIVQQGLKRQGRVCGT